MLFVADFSLQNSPSTGTQPELPLHMVILSQESFWQALSNRILNIIRMQAVKFALWMTFYNIKKTNFGAFFKCILFTSIQIYNINT